MNDEKVLVKSAINAKVGITLPEYRFKQEWNRKGAKALIDKQTLEDIMFEPGVEYMFKNGILYIEDMETKKELFSTLDGICKESCIFGTNTSSLSVTEIAKGIKHPVPVGLHI